MSRLFVFLGLVSTLLAVCGAYIGHRLIASSATLAAHSFAVWTFLALFLIAVLVGPILSRILPSNLRGRGYPIRWAFNMTMGIFFALLFYTVLIDAVGLLLGLFLEIDSKSSVLVLAILTGVTILIGALQALAPRIYRVDVPLENLPREFDGFTIAQISDLHIGEMIGGEYVRAVVEKTNSLKANLIALTGDIIDGAPDLVGPVSGELGRLRAADGVFYVTGNHEYYWGIENAVSAIRKTGIKVLLNEHILIARGGEFIAIAGVTDISAGRGVAGHTSDPEKSVRGLAKNIFKILLAHQPASFREALRAGFQLQLSGHTHGGQFFPWSLVVRLFQRYNSGLVRHDDLWIYVNRGTATWGPRLRFLIPPEITLLTLRRGP